MENEETVTKTKELTENVVENPTKLDTSEFISNNSIQSDDNLSPLSNHSISEKVPNDVGTVLYSPGNWEPQVIESKSFTSSCQSPEDITDMSCFNNTVKSEDDSFREKDGSEATDGIGRTYICEKIDATFVSDDSKNTSSTELSSTSNDDSKHSSLIAFNGSSVTGANSEPAALDSSTDSSTIESSSGSSSTTRFSSDSSTSVASNESNLDTTGDTSTSDSSTTVASKDGASSTTESSSHFSSSSNSSTTEASPDSDSTSTARPSKFSSDSSVVSNDEDQNNTGSTTTEASNKEDLNTTGNTAKNSSTVASSTPLITNISPPSIVITPSTEDQSDLTSTDNSLMNSMSFKDSSEHAGDSDEDYFEEYHLPNTHENAFVRHLSFRRKVQTTPIHAPDADRIEGLVRAGEFVRHGSIGKKILPEEVKEEEEEDEEEEGEESEFEDDPEDHDKNSSSFSKRIEGDLREIERYLSEDNLNSVGCEVAEVEPLPQITPRNAKKLKRKTSTPKTITSESDVSTRYGRNDSSIEETQQYENSSIEDTTLRKIQDCLDISSYKDLLNLSGRLSDMLSPKEVEEVLLNSERYRQYLDTEVFEALSLSYQGQTQSLPYNVNVSKSQDKPPANISDASKSDSKSTDSRKSLPHTDSGFSSPKSPKDDSKESENNAEDAKIDAENSSEVQLIEKNSDVCEGIESQEIFGEVQGSKSDLKKIPAPKLELDWSSDTTSKQEDICDYSHEDFESKEADAVPTRKRISVNEEILSAMDSKDNISVAYEAVEGNIIGMRDENGEILAMHLPVPEDTDLPPPEMFPAPPPPDLIPELTAAEELSEVRHWRNVVIGGAWRRIDMKVIAPFRKCVSHGGYMENSQSPIVVLSAALLPEKTRKDYHYVMDNLFMYVLSYLEQLVADDYVLVYFSGGRQNSSGPGFHWMRRAYEMIDRRLRKNLKSLLVVHPSLWSRTIIALSRPFISSKFYRKLSFVQHLTDLAQLVPLEQLEIPDAVKQADFEIMIREKKKHRPRR